MRLIKVREILHDDCERDIWVNPDAVAGLSPYDERTSRVRLSGDPMLLILTREPIDDLANRLAEGGAG